VNAGIVNKRLVYDAGGRGIISWELGPTVKVQAVLATPAQDPAPVGEIPSTSPPAPADPVVEEIKAILDAQEVATQDPAGFACALFNDGRLYLELGDETMTLQVEHARALLAYLERVAIP